MPIISEVFTDSFGEYQNTKWLKSDRKEMKKFETQKKKEGWVQRNWKICCETSSISIQFMRSTEEQKQKLNKILDKMLQEIEELKR